MSIFFKSSDIAPGSFTRHLKQVDMKRAPGPAQGFARNPSEAGVSNSGLSPGATAPAAAVPAGAPGESFATTVIGLLSPPVPAFGIVVALDSLLPVRSGPAGELASTWGVSRAADCIR